MDGCLSASICVVGDSDSYISSPPRATSASGLVSLRHTLSPSRYLSFSQVGYKAARWDKPGLPPYSVGFVSVAAVLLLMPASLLTAKLGELVAHSASNHR